MRMCQRIGRRPCRSRDCITYGVCNVFIPKSHKPGSTGTAWWRRWIRLEADDSLQVHGIHALPRDVFWTGLAHKFATWWKSGRRNMFVLIHGFNVSFEEAAIRAAQIGYDLKVPGRGRVQTAHPCQSARPLGLRVCMTAPVRTVRRTIA